MSLPKITVVTPSFNQGHYLEATFKSVLAQDYPNLEWFVVDGGSKDNSVDLIKKYEKHFAWWISEKDRNHPHALNKGYEKATGEIFCFVNSDDLLRPGALHYVAKKFAEPNTDWVVGWATYFEDSGDEWEYSVKKTQRPIDWFLHNPVPQISSFWRTEAYKKAGPFHREVPLGLRLRVLDAPVFRRRLSPDRRQALPRRVPPPAQQQDGFEAGKLRPRLQGDSRGVQQVSHPRRNPPLAPRA
jgi:glycosyltransferase involved in cell wall biosynthesis